MKRPAYELRLRKLVGAPYISHSLYVGGVCIRSQLSPFTPAEAEACVLAYLAPRPPMPKFVQPRPGRPRRARTNERGFLWRDGE